MSEMILSSPAPAAPRPRLATWQLYLGLVLASILISLAANELVMTREVYHAVMGDQLDAVRVEAYFDMTRRLAVWGYAVVPLAVLVRLAFVALIIQLVLLLLLVEMRFTEIFRSVALAFPALLYAEAVRVGWLAFQDSSAITAATLAVRPASLANLLPAGDPADPVFMLLGFFNLFELAWGVIVFLGLRSTGRLRPFQAGAVVAGVWLGLTLFHWGLMSYLSRIAA